MASTVHESEKDFRSINMNANSFKEDRELLKNKYTYKKKMDIITPALLLLTIVMAGCITLNLLFLIGVLISLILFVVSFYISKKKRDQAFINYYEEAIRQNGVLTYQENSTCLSTLFPLYAKWDNEDKIIDFIYQNNTHIHVGFDDILNYRILVEDKEIEETKLPPLPDHTKTSFTLELTFNNMKKAQFRFSNATVKLGFNYLENIKRNAEAINNVADILDMIIMKNEIVIKKETN